MLSRAEHLHTFLGEIGVKPRKRKPWTIDGRLANFSMEADGRALKLHVQFFGVRFIKALDRDNWNALLLIALGCNRLRPGFVRHQT
jgi:hypothetical protein